MNTYTLSNISKYFRLHLSFEKYIYLSEHPSFEQYLVECYCPCKQCQSGMIFVDDPINNSLWSFDCEIRSRTGVGPDLCYQLYIGCQEENLTHGYHQVGGGTFKYYPNKAPGSKFTGRLKDRYNDGFTLTLYHILPYIFRTYPR